MNAIQITMTRAFCFLCLLACGGKAASQATTGSTTGTTTASTGSSSGANTGADAGATTGADTGATTGTTAGATTGTPPCAAHLTASATGCAKVEVGNGFVWFLRGDGALFGWGENEDYALSGTDDLVPTPTRFGGTDTFVDVSAQATTTCAVASTGVAKCWGDNDDGKAGSVVGINVSVPTALPGSTWARVHAGERVGCGIQIDGSLWCWGDNNDGLLGQGTDDSNDHPVPVQISGGPWAQVASHDDSVCALDTAGALFCWGGDEESDVGRAGEIKSPGLVDAGPFALVRMAKETTCAIKKTAGEGGELWCFGKQQGFLGANADRLTLVGPEQWTALSTEGSGEWCGRRDGVWVCVGDPSAYVWPGVANDADPLTPHAIALDYNAFQWSSAIGCGFRSSDGALVCSGSRKSGGTGSGAEAPVTVPTRVGTATYASVFGSADGVCAVTTATGNIHCFGSNGSQRFLLAGVSVVDAPVQVSDLSSVTSVAFKSSGLLASTSDGSAWAWGDSMWVASGAYVDYATPTQLPGVSSVEQVVAYVYGFAFLRSSGSSLLIGGHNYGGLLGRNVSSNETVYDADDTGTLDTSTIRYQSVSMGAFHSMCALRSTSTAGERTLWCWGNNVDNQAGHVSTSDVTDDADGQVGSATTWRAVHVGSRSTCARKADKSLLCFGSNGRGLLGRGNNDTTLKDATPTSVGGTYGAFSLSGQVACAITSPAKKIVCWGSREDGVIGSGLTGIATSPTVVALADATDTFKDIVVTDSSACALRDDGALYCWGAAAVNGLGQRYDRLPTVVVLP